MSVQENWQTKRSTIRERTKFMINNALFSDVKFVVRKSDGESEIPAHKFVLSIGSPVFEAMFYGELAETRDSIELPDCEYESLLELFRYMYSDEVNLSGSNVMRVLYLAKKYMVPSLAEKCTDLYTVFTNGRQPGTSARPNMESRRFRINICFRGNFGQLTGQLTLKLSVI